MRTPCVGQVMLRVGVAPEHELLSECVRGLTSALGSSSSLPRENHP